MVIDWSQSGDEAAPPPPTVRAAEYVRMSTEHQKYSTDNQAAEIRRYAERRGYEIVRTYADEGRSGLSLAGRNALQLLLEDIEKGRADYAVVLVYDVSCEHFTLRLSNKWQTESNVQADWSTVIPPRICSPSIESSQRP